MTRRGLRRGSWFVGAPPPKQQKVAKGKGKASSVDSREDQTVAEVHLQNSVWDPRLELDGSTIPCNTNIKEFQKWHAHYLAETLEQPLLLLRDMDALKRVRQPDLFLSQKRDLAWVSFLDMSY